ncbi:hypothetical protein [Dyadobacter sp. 676]|uniref:Uncharacterized protein n=1 Tax=Dyadobacter sp. 676 TaxID=3088362 RepID=A0AAU8FQZ3_9BACT
MKSKRNLTMLDLVGDIVSKVPRGLALIASLSEGGKKGVVFTMPQFEHLGFANWGLAILNDSELIQYRDAVNISNKEVRRWAQEYDLAVVDLEALYKAIHRKEYVLQNGLLIDSSMRGNFFSSDGLYPTTLGQVIIANEVLKSINEKYGADVPLIDIPLYASKIGLNLKTGQ